MLRFFDISSFIISLNVVRLQFDGLAVIFNGSFVVFQLFFTDSSAIISIIVVRLQVDNLAKVFDCSFVVL